MAGQISTRRIAAHHNHQIVIGIHPQRRFRCGAMAECPLTQALAFKPNRADAPLQRRARVEDCYYLLASNNAVRLMSPLYACDRETRNFTQYPSRTNGGMEV